MLAVQFMLPRLKGARGHLKLCLLSRNDAAAVTHSTIAATFSAVHVICMNRMQSNIELPFANGRLS